METLVLANKTWFETLPKEEQDRLKLENPDIENSMWFQYDVVETHPKGHYTETNRINGYGKDDFILIINNKEVIETSIEKEQLMKLESFVYQELDEIDPLTGLNKIKLKKIRRYKIEFDKLTIIPDTQGRRIYYEPDFSKLKIVDKEKNKAIISIDELKDDIIKVLKIGNKNS